ncbi:hypothetical protein SAMN04488491_2259 [Psychrobacter sp. LV10R520-6]|nr:hypothetical protein SAMN04488491_2259 [Psychrobacter sp. LV10R520-6]
MSDKKKSTIKVSVGDSYTPKSTEKSYQPTPVSKPGASYTPTSAGSEPTIRPRPTPPGKE